MLFYISGHVISLEVCTSVEDYTDDVSDQCRDIIKRLQYVNPTINEVCTSVCTSCMFVSVYVLCVCQYVLSCMFVIVYVLYVYQCVCPVCLSVCMLCMFVSVYVLYVCQCVRPVCYTELLTLKSA